MSKIPWSWRDNVKRKRLGAQRERKEEMEEREEEEGGRKGFDIPHCKGMRKSLAYYPCCFAAVEEKESWDTVREMLLLLLLLVSACLIPVSSLLCVQEMHIKVVRRKKFLLEKLLFSKKENIFYSFVMSCLNHRSCRVQPLAPMPVLILLF